MAIERGIFQERQQWVALVNLATLYRLTSNKEKWYQTIQKLSTLVIYFDDVHKNNVLYWKYTRISVSSTHLRAHET